METTKGIGFGKRLVTACGMAAIALTFGLGSAAADRFEYQPGDAGGHAAADLQAANERQAAALARGTRTRWNGDAAGFAARDLQAANERQAAALARGRDDEILLIQYEAAGVTECADNGGPATNKVATVVVRSPGGGVHATNR